MADLPDKSSFEERLDEPFRVYPEAGNPLEMKLIEVTSLGPKSVAPSATQDLRDSFSIVFRGPADRPLEQRIYRMAHDSLSSFEIFLVPIGPDQEGLCYEAVFN